MGLINDLLNFVDKYVACCELGFKEKYLVIGGYKSAFLDDLVVSYLFEKCNNKLREVLRIEIYRDKAFLLFKGKKALSQIKIWRYEFHSTVNKASGNKYLQFTRELWRPNVCPSRTKLDNVL